ncbi:MAG: hypothetical protein IPF83_13435 [Rhodanobacteraceae bacterium]|nr:hypothetical protein [Rhodanobacteraceae bacterium]MBP9155554.1 hypothetical protein [Xanthomonadales bacterium]HQW81501.1 TonB-dependent receptor [Pseudomonadota bacterium]
MIRRLSIAMYTLMLASLAASADTPSIEGIDALEARLRTLEASSLALQEQTAATLAALAQAREQIVALQAVVPSAAVASSASAFNPAISIILNGGYAHHSLDSADYALAGFALAGEGGPGAQGLSLGESEISFAANIDEKFYGQVTLAIESEEGEDGVGVEEAYVETTALPDGLTARAGRFFSNIGYLNTHHAHTDAFSNRPLVYQALLGNQYADDGVQLRWIAPTDTYLELGGELMRGQSFPSGGAANAGTGVRTLFAHAGGDVGVEHSWLAGVSVVDARTQAGDDGFNGDNRLYLADFTWKWAPNGNTRDGGVTLRSEYLRDQRDGRYIDPEQGIDTVWEGSRRGAYLEGVWRINRQWDAGYRYDRLWADDDGPYASDVDPVRHNLMLTWRNSEFSLIRLQYSHDVPAPDLRDNAISLQYQTALGAHGAHKF